MRHRLRAVQLAIVTAVTAGAVRAQSTIQDLQNFQADTDQYNLIALGNVNLQGSSDTQGGIAVKGTLTVGGAWTIASQTKPGSNPSLYLSGSSLSLSGTTYVNNGYASTPGLSGSQWSWSGSQNKLTNKKHSSQVLAINGGGQTTSPLTAPGPSGWNWTTEQTNLDTINTDLANTSANGSISVSGQNLVFTPPTGMTSGVAVFSLDASKLSGNSYNGQTISDISINVPSGVNYVINVVNLSKGQTLFGSGVNFNSGTNDNQLLWNIVGSDTFTLSGGGNFYGSILAPTSTLTDQQTVDGQVVVQNVTNSGVELHDTGFTAVAVLVPEARTFAWWAVGLCAACVVFRRRLVPGRQA